MNTRRRTLRRPHVGAQGQGYGSTSTSGFPFNMPQQDCVQACEPTVVGNAGMMGCGTGTIPGTECSLKILFRNSGAVPAGTQVDIEALAGRGGAFKPRAVYMIGVATGDTATNVRFEILNITVLGDPQLINFDGASQPLNRGITDFFNLQCAPQPVDWATIGASQGQGLVITVVNTSADEEARLYVALWGDGASTSLIGK
jgi:hypothetical protein